MEKRTLYGIEKDGSIKQWSVWTEGGTITVEWGQFEGKLQTKNTVCAPKNVGRSNETTAEQQAESEAISKWNKQQLKYYRETIEEAQALTTEGVMLAQDYSKKPHCLEEEFYLSPKLDGLRVKTIFDDEGNPSWESRGAKTYQIPGHIEGDLRLLYQLKGPFKFLDGEAYCHGMPLQKINSAVKKHKDITAQLEYHIFDVPDSRFGFEHRLTYLMAPLRDAIEELPSLVLVDQHYCHKQSMIGEFMAKYLAAGYEGVMLRNLCGEYLFQNKRSNDLLKYKEFIDSECKVIGCLEDKNGEGVLTAEWSGQEQEYDEPVIFELKMKGNHAYRSYETQQGLIDSWVNFKYQGLTEDNKPTFAVGTGERECDENGRPIE